MAPARPMRAPTLCHHFTVDVEEYFQVSAMESTVPRSIWHRQESRVRGSVIDVLSLLDDHGARGTFFILGWVAERHPDLVREIAGAGHEVASHGWLHRRVPEMAHEEFRRSVRHTKEVLEDVTGRPVFGYRAPSFSITPGHEWALDVLIEEGYRYDSSLFPVRRNGYGYPEGTREPYTVRRSTGELKEVPPATLRWMGVNLPAGGGAYLRHLPLQLMRSALQAFEDQGVPGTLYIHPWELDPGQPRLPTSLLTGLRHYRGLDRTRDRLAKLLAEFRFDSISNTLALG